MSAKSAAPEIPRDADNAVVEADSREVRLTNLRKPFWKEPPITKGDLLRYYTRIAPALLPHVKDRAMVMKRYAHGAEGEFFFMKRAPSPRPDWIALCSITHGSGNVIDFPMVQDLATLLWIVNLGPRPAHCARAMIAVQNDAVLFLSDCFDINEGKDSIEMGFRCVFNRRHFADAGPVFPDHRIGFKNTDQQLAELAVEDRSVG